MRESLQRIVAMGALGVAVGCSDRGPAFEQRVDVAAVAVLGSHLVYADSGNDRVAWLDVGDAPQAELEADALPAHPVSMTQRNGSDELLVLCRTGAGDNPSDVATSLVVVDESGVDRSYELHSRYDTLVQSEDGQYAFLYGQGGDGASLLTNPNDVTILELDADSGVEPLQRTLTSQDESPSGVVFSPELDVDGARLKLAIVLFPSSVSLLDLSRLDDPDYSEYVVQLNRPVGFEQVAYSPERGHLFLRASAGEDLFMLQLSPSEGASANDFVPSLNQLPLGARATDMMVYEVGGEERLAVMTTAGPKLAHVATSEVRSLSVGAVFQHVLGFQREGLTQALLYGEGTSEVVFVDLSTVDDRPQHSAEHVTVRSQYDELRQLTEEQLLLTRRSGGFTVVDLVQRVARPIGLSSGSSFSVLFDPGEERVWVHEQGGQRLGYFGLDGLQPAEVRLDAPITQAFLVAGSGGAQIVTLHNSATGYVTVVDAERPSRDSAVTLKGFFVEGILDRGND